MEIQFALDLASERTEGAWRGFTPALVGGRDREKTE